MVVLIAACAVVVQAHSQIPQGRAIPAIDGEWHVSLKAGIDRWKITIHVEGASLSGTLSGPWHIEPSELGHAGAGVHCSHQPFEFEEVPMTGDVKGRELEIKASGSTEHGQWTKVFAGTLKDDGTMTGTLSMIRSSRGDEAIPTEHNEWTAVRVIR
jgi:hypothetical protein